MQNDPRMGRENEIKRGTSRFRTYLFASFLGNLVAPIFSLFLPVLAVDIGATVFEVGLIGGAENIVYAFMPFVMGHFTDRGKSRQFFILSGFGLLVCVSAFYSLASSPFELIVARLFEGLGWAIVWPAIESSITVDTVGNSGRALSLFNTSWSLGAALGPLVGGIVIVFGSSRFVYLATAFALFVALAANFYSFTKHKDEIPDLAARHRHSLIEAAKKIFQRHDAKKNFQVRLYVASLILSYATVGVLYTFFGPYAKALGMSALLFSLPVVLFGLIRLFIFVLCTRGSFRSKLLDPAKRNLIVFLSLLLTCSSPLLILVRDPSGGTYFLAFGLFAVGLALVYFICQVGMIAETNETQMGAGAGIFESVIGIGSALGPIVAGAISTGSLTSAFLVPFAGFAIVMLFFGIDAKRLQERGSSPQHFR